MTQIRSTRIDDNRQPSGRRTASKRLVGQASLHADRLVPAALAQEGMRRHHYAVLAERGPASQADLGRRLWIDRVAAAQEAFLAPLDAREREQLSELLARLIDHHRG